MDLYNEKIDEFVDWVNGRDLITEEDRTGGRAVSGSKIRLLLQDHLVNPIKFVEDKRAGLYRVFSSEEAYHRWQDDPENNSDLLKFTFARPSEYQIDIDGIANETRYLTNGDSSQAASKLIYSWEVKNDKGSYPDMVSVTYTITTPDKRTTSFTHHYDSFKTDIEVDLYSYLAVGTNRVLVTFTGESTGASAQISMIFIVLDFRLTSTFNFSQDHTDGELLFKTGAETVYLLRNDDSLKASVYFYVDGQLILKKDIPENAGTQLPIETHNIQNTFGVGLHNLLIVAKTLYNASEFQSNILYYTFVNKDQNAKIDYFIPFGTEISGGIPPISNFELQATLHSPFALQWGYYTNAVQSNTSISVDWKLVKFADAGHNEAEVLQEISSLNGSKGYQSEDLRFSPTIYSGEDLLYLCAYHDEYKIIELPINISKSPFIIEEASSYDLKLNAYGKSNLSEDKDVWEYTNSSGTTFNTTFTGINWDDNSGWYNNSLRVCGNDQYAIVNYMPLANNPSNGRTIEIEFESENVEDTSDVIIRIGGTNGGRIDITPNSATLYSAEGTERIHTNFKANERVKLAFIINEQNNDVDSTLLFIVNNGILERGAGGGYNFLNNFDTIKIGGSASGVRVYSMRVYLRAITYNDEYNNFVYDSENKNEILYRNDVTEGGIIDFDECANRIDTILISGNLGNLLKKETSKDKSETDVTIERICPFDPSKNFKVVDAKIRKHGQSTLNYPVPSMKFWLNKSKNPDKSPVLTWPGGTEYDLAKNRYIAFDGSIPANKFVLQANYADSSGVHNGSILKIIQDSWYNAQFKDGQFKLRTDPQLFTTNATVTMTDGSVIGKNSQGNQWSNYYDRSFPYNIRIAPDSVPCVVFYQDTEGTGKRTFLGQYVLMDDKKSDYTYGERSIYKSSPSDPFCVTNTQRKNDTDSNKIWDNKRVLRIEVVNINTLFTSFMQTSDNSGIDIEDQVRVEVQDGTGEEETVKTVNMYRWEQDFELIYPDEDDIVGHLATDLNKSGVPYGTDTTKFGADSEFRKKTKPFIDWYRWLVATRNDWNKTVSGGSGNTSYGWTAGQYRSAQECFQDTAPQHLDLYKLAAYYVTFLRLGLVDSVERNALLKTYDGQHWHYESWDMDIALGNKNTGGIAFDPPINRDTRLPSDRNTFAYSGRSVNKNTGEIITSNWLWDALEAWPQWNAIVIETADALFNAGFSYDSLTEIFDNDFAKKWCETIYNASGWFKYIQQRGSDNGWLNWLQGSRETHRHWWLSTSMDYYDAKWLVGDFKNHSIYIAANHDENVAGNITITPNASTFFQLTINDTKDIYANAPDGSASRYVPAVFNITSHAFSTKTPLLLYGATYIEQLDLSSIADGIDIIRLGGAYSKVQGAPIKVLNVGTKITKVDDNHYTGRISGYNINITSDLTSTSGDGYDSGYDALLNIHTLNMRGQAESNFGLQQELRVKDRSQLKNFYAMGGQFSGFYSSKTGNSYDVLELPGVNKRQSGEILSQFSTLELNSSRWNEISFWNATVQDNNNAIYERCNVNGDYSLNIPTSLTSVRFTGSTCENEKSKEFILKWIECIKAEKGVEALNTYSLDLERINWTGLTYENMADLARFNNYNNKNGNHMQGYIVLTNDELTSQQLTKLREWFGESVFSLKSQGIVIDQYTDYMRINVGADAVVVDDTIVLQEGHSASLNATQFKLAESIGDYEWRVGAPNGQPSSAYKSVQIKKGLDGVTRLVASESTYGDYDAKLSCFYKRENITQTVDIIVHIVGVTYPTGYDIKSALVDNMPNVRQNNTTLIFWGSGIGSEIYIEPIAPVYGYTATIQDVKFTLTNNSGNVLLDNVSFRNFDTNDTSLLSITDELFIGYRLTSPHPYGITLIQKDDPGEDVYKYTLSATIIYESKTDTITKNITVSNDGLWLIDGTMGDLYDAISEAYIALEGVAPQYNTYYKSELSAITGTIDFSTHTGAQFTTQLGDSVFKYLPNILSLDLTGTGITSDLLNLDYMPALKSIKFVGNNNFNGTLYLPANVKSVTFENGRFIPIAGALNHKINQLTIDDSYGPIIKQFAEFSDKLDTNILSLSIGAQLGNNISIDCDNLLKLQSFFQKIIDEEITVNTANVASIRYDHSDIFLLQASELQSIYGTVGQAMRKITGAKVDIYQFGPKTTAFSVSVEDSNTILTITSSAKLYEDVSAVQYFSFSNNAVIKTSSYDQSSGMTTANVILKPGTTTIVAKANILNAFNYIELSFGKTGDLLDGIKISGNVLSLFSPNTSTESIESVVNFIRISSLRNPLDLSDLYVPIGGILRPSGESLSTGAYSHLFTRYSNVNKYPTLYFCGGGTSYNYFDGDYHAFGTESAIIPAVIYKSVQNIDHISTCLKNSNLLKANIKSIKVPNKQSNGIVITDAQVRSVFPNATIERYDIEF